MDRSEPARRGSGRSFRSGSVVLLLLFLVAGPAFAACSATHQTSGGASSAAMPTMRGGVPPADAGASQAAPADMPMADADALWAARPAYVRANPTTEAAYHYAINHPQIVKWMPCYCGCGAMGHESNLDCYVKPGQATFEEHASFCDICVKITLKTKDLIAQGKTLKEIRWIVDQTWGGSVPGTPTALPPV